MVFPSVANVQPVEGTGVSGRGKRDEGGIDEQGSNREAIHAIVILQRTVTG